MQKMKLYNKSLMYSSSPTPSELRQDNESEWKYFE